MTRNEREQALWHDAYMLAMSQDPDPAESSGWADAAVAQFRKRYPAEPAADGNASAKALIALLDDIAGDAAFPGLSDTMQTRIYAAIESLRKGQTAAPTPVWHDDPPFEKDGKSYPCWVDGCVVHGDVHWDDGRWQVWIVGSAYQHPLAGRRVCPIVKPQETTT